MKDTWTQINILKWGAFQRIGLLFLYADYRHETEKMRAKIKRENKLAQKENAEADLFIKEYVKKAEAWAIQDLPF